MRCMIHIQIDHKRRKITIVVIAVIKLVSVFRMEQVFAFAVVVPVRKERQYLVGNRYSSDSVFCFAELDIKILFVQVYVLSLEIQHFGNPHTRINQHKDDLIILVVGRFP